MAESSLAMKDYDTAEVCKETIEEITEFVEDTHELIRNPVGKFAGRAPTRDQ